MSLVKFNTGSRDSLDETPINNGAVYFLPDANDGLGDIAYDLDDCRSWVTSSKILTTNDLDSSIPKLGELIVVTDALVTIDEQTGNTSVLPGLKIGDGVTSVSALPYLNDGYRVNADVLGNQYAQLSATVETHIKDTDIHHTKNAEVEAVGDQFVLKIWNYD